jgi:hypothetical protein
MKYEGNITREYDIKFSKIQNIKYLPWVGRNALNNNKTLVIGESVYNWEKEEGKRKIAYEKLDKNDFARVVAYEHGIENPNSKRIFARNIEKTLNNPINNQSERDLFWENLCFHELVQRPLENSKDRPNKSDYNIGADVLTEIIKILKPSKCIFLGTTWQKFNSLKKSINNNFNTSETHYPKINNAAPKVLSIDELNTKIYFIKHPSRAYNVDAWKDFINNN